MTYQELINTITTHNATVKTVATALTLGKAFRGAAQDAIDSGRIVRRWWKSSGRIYATMAAIVLVLVGCALVAAAQVTYRWLRDAGVPMTLTALDSTCRFLLCYEAPQVVAAPPAPQESIGFSNPLAEELIAWAMSLKVAA